MPDQDNRGAPQAMPADREELELALLEEVRRYRLLYDAVPLAFVMTDHVGTIVAANQTAAQLLQASDDPLVGRPLSAFVTESDRHELKRFTVDLLRRREQSTLRVHMRSRRGVTFEAELRATATPLELTWAIVDLTEERRAEEAAAWQLNRDFDARVETLLGSLQDVYNELPIGVVVIEAGTQLARSFNRRASQILDGWDGGADSIERLDARGQPLPLQDWPVTRALAGQRVSHQIVRIRIGDRPEALLNVNAVPLRDGEGQVTAAVLTFEDLSARARKEESDAQFVENAAHQLRTPIAAITSAAAALQAGAKDEPDARERFLGHIDRESERIGRLLDALLRLARLQRDGVQPNVSLLPLRPLLAELAAEAQPRAGVMVTVDCSQALAAIGDAALLRESLGNVVANAVAHTLEGSIRLSARLEGTTAIVDVADTGAGIPDDKRERVFDRFYRGAAQERSGAGLGLSIARHAIEACGGTLRLLAQEPGLGATFRFELPGAMLVT